MRKISRKTAVLTMGLLFVLPVLFYFQNAQAIWIQPEQITDNYILRDDTQITVTFDGKGYIHYASVLNDAQAPENYIYYGNNSKPGYTDSDFLEAEGDKEELGNREGDGLNLTQLANPSISASEDGTPVIGFDANVVEIGHREAFASVVDTKSGAIRRHQLSFADQSVYRNIPYSKFTQIARVGTSIIASVNESYSYITAITSPNTLNPANQTRLNFLGTPKKTVYNGSLLFAAAGKTLIIYPASSLAAIGEYISYMPFENDIDGLYYKNDTNTLFLSVKNRIYAINVFNPANPRIESSKTFDVEGMYNIIGKNQYLYIACGITGLKTIRYQNEEFTSTMTRPNPTPGKRITDVVFGNSNNLHIGAENGIFSSQLTNPAEPTGLSLEVATSPVVSIAYDNAVDKLVVSLNDANELLYYTGYETGRAGYSWGTLTETPNDVEIEGNYIYAAALSAGLLKLDITTPWIPSASYLYTQNCTYITKSGSYTIASDIATDISVIDHTTLTSVGNKTTASGNGPMYVDNNYIYINDQRYGLVIADATDITNVKLVTIKPLNGPMYGGLFVYNRIVYIAGEYGKSDLAIIDASNFGSLGTPIYYNFTDVTLKDVLVINNGTQTWGYASDFPNAALVYFNLTNNLLIPSYNSTLTNIITSPSKMVFFDNKIYVCGSNGVQTIGLSNMGAPSDDGENNFGGVLFKEIAIEDGVIFVSDGTATVRYYDLKTPGTIRTEVASSAVNSFVVFDCAIFAATQSSGIGVFDVSKHDGIATTGDSYVSVAHFTNGTAVAIWIDSSSNLYYRKIYPNNIKSQIRLIGNYPGILTPVVKIAEFGNESYIHIVYANTDTGIYYSFAKNGFSFSVPSVVQTGSSARVKPRMSVEKSVVGIVWEYQNANRDITAAISSNNGSSFTIFTITSSTSYEYSPDIYVTWDGRSEVVYQRQISPYNYSIFVKGCRDILSTTFGSENILVEYQQSVTSYANPKIAQKFGTVVIFYEYSKYQGSVWWAADICVLGYQLLNYNMGGNYNTLTIRDDPAGSWLFSGFRIGFNTTTLTDIKLNFTIVDNDTVAPNATFPTWSNVTTIPGNGTQYSEYYFYSPGNYFISHNKFTLYIMNASDISNVLIRIPLETFQLQTEQIYNITTPGSNGTYLNYSINIYPIFEYDNNLILDPNGLENELNPYYGKFGLPNSEQPAFQPNFVDLKYFLLEENRRYNFYLTNNTAANSTSGHFRLRLYNASTILTAKDTPYFIMDSQNITSMDFRCPVGGTYGVLIEPAFASDYGRIMEYKFYFSAAPLPTSILAPRNRTFIAHTENNTTNLQPIELSWGFNVRDNDVIKFQLEIYTNQSLPLNSLVYNKTLMGIGTTTHIFNATEQTGYYWRVRAIDDSTPENLGDWGPIGVFYYDPTPPEAPDVYELPWDTSVNYVSMTWNASYDGPYIVPKYYIYISNRPVFTKGLQPEEKYLYDTVGVSTLGVVLKNLRNYHYYIVVVAEDNVGQRSNASNVVHINVAIGGYISAAGKEFGVQVGDTFLYEITYVESDNKDVNQQPTMEYFYRRYPVNALFHFWVQYLDTNQVYPVLATFYSRNQYEWDNDWFLVDDQIPITIFALAKDEIYQLNVFGLFVKNNVGDKIVGNQTYDTLWRRGTDVLNVRVFTFYGELDGDGKQTSISFFVEKTSGIVCEMIYYDKSQDYGYSIQLVETSVTMTHNDWRYSPLYLILALAAIGAIISGIIKKVEF